MSRRRARDRLSSRPSRLTEFFGLGWPDAPHDLRGPRWIRLVNRLASPLAVRVPVALQDRVLAIQRPSLPFLAPPMALDDGPPSVLDSGPLYAGANVTRISDIRPATQIVNSLTP
jgi:nitronate monooxygenase